MALAILDGTQTATTLSSVVTGGEHIVAHSVVSLGSNAISNIATAVSGSTVCVGNLGLLQSTVATEGLSASGSFIKIGGHTGTSTTGNIVHVSAVGALRVDGSVYTQPVSIASVTIGNTVTIAGTVTANPTGTQAIAGTVTVGALPPLENNTDFVNVGAQIAEGINTELGVYVRVALSSAAITSGSFASLTSATLVPANTARKMATVYNLGAGQLFVNAGSSATTLGGGFMVALSSGDFFECDYTTTTLSAIFATAGTASWVSH